MAEKNREDLFGYASDEQFKGQLPKEIFTGIYKNNIWQDEESVSDPGSALMQTEEIIKALPVILRDLKIKTMLDIPCGDFNWMGKVNLDGIHYTGADIVAEIIERNNKNHISDNRNFLHVNMIEDKLEPFDFIFCRDCLVYFSYEDIFSSLANIKQSGSKYFMTTTFTDQDENKNIHTGGWRPLNFELEPFNLPKPILLINEKCTEMDGKFSDKS